MKKKAKANHEVKPHISRTQDRKIENHLMQYKFGKYSNQFFPASIPSNQENHIEVITELIQIDRDKKGTKTNLSF